MAKLGTLLHVKGFILNKLFEGGYLTTAQHHGKHTPSFTLRQGYPPQYRGFFPDAFDQLRADGFILYWRARTGRGTDWHVALQKEQLSRARPMINAYRRSVGLRPYNRQFTALL